VAETLPLFPLGEVLFPGVPLPLRIFEPRYRAMLKHCLDRRAPFGVVLITRGDAEHPGADFCPVGTTARIQGVQRVDQTTFLVASVGEQRFRVLHPLDGQPYLQGQVEFIPEQPGDRDALDGLTTQGLALLSRYLELITGSDELGENLRERDFSPQSLSYTVGKLMQVDQTKKQAILEVATTAARLAYEVDLLRDEIQQLRLLGKSEQQATALPAYWSPN